MKHIIEHDITISVCPISNQMAGLLTALRNHPAQTYINQVHIYVSLSLTLTHTHTHALSVGYDGYQGHPCLLGLYLLL